MITKDKLAKIEQERVDEQALRLMFVGAADVITRYAVSKQFNFERDIELLRPIAQATEKLQAILDAAKERRQ